MACVAIIILIYVSACFCAKKAVQSILPDVFALATSVQIAVVKVLVFRRQGFKNGATGNSSIKRFVASKAWWVIFLFADMQCLKMLNKRCIFS